MFEINFLDLAENSLAGFYVMRDDGLLKYVNSRCAEIFGYTAEEVVDILKVDDVIFPGDWPLVKDSLRRRSPGQLPFHHYEFRILTKGGDVKNVEVYSSATTYKEEPAIIGMLLDITDRRRAEADLKLSEAKFKEIFETIEDLYFETDVEGKITVLSPSVTHLTGWDREDLIGKPDTDSYVNADDRQYFLSKLSEKGYVHDYELLLKKKDGTERHASLSGRFIIDREGRPAGVRGLLRDITERKRAEQGLRENELKFRTLFDSAHDAIFTMKDHLFLDCNSKTLNMFGCGKDDIIGRSPVDFSPGVQPDGIPSRRKAIEKMNLALTGSPQTFEWRHQRMDGAAFDTEVSLNRFELDGAVYLQAIVRDMTERKQAEDQLAVSEQQLRAILLASPIGIARARDRMLEWANERMCEITGYDLKDLIGRNPLFLYESPAEYERAGKLLYTQGVAETKWVRKDGAVRDILMQATRVPGGTHINTATDITEFKRTEELLRQREVQLRDTAENIPGVVYQFYARPGGTMGLYYVSESAERIFGLNSDPDDFFERFSARVAPEYAESFAASITDVVMKIKPWNYEGRFIKDSGETIWFLGLANPTSSGREIVFNGVLLDVTERKRAEQALLESEGKFRDLAEKSVVGIYLYQDGLFKYVNTEFAATFGYIPSEIIDRLTLQDVIFHEDLPLVEESVRQRTSGDVKSKRYQFRAWARDGTLRHVEVYGSQTSYQGKPAVIGTVLDITDRLKTEEELKRLSTAIEQSAEDVIITDLDGVIQYVNPAFEKITGYSREEAIGQTPRIVKSGAHDETFYDNLWKTIKGGMVWTGQVTNRRKDGSLIQEAAIISPFINSSGQLTGYIALKRDITEEAKLQSQLWQAQKMEAVGTLAGGIAHDFNNILTVIMGFGTILQLNMQQSDPLKHYVDQILSSAEKATNLTRSLLAFSRKQPITLAPINLNDCIKGTEKLLKRLLTEDIELSISLVPEDVIVLADATQVDQILFNLATNARDAMKNGGALTIETRLFDMESRFVESHGFGIPGKYARLIVSDTGSGMEESTRERLFDPFFTTKEPGRGTGLGLATVYGIVKQHKGYIDVRSEPQKGTTFFIYFPVAKDIAQKEPQVFSESPVANTGTETILVAEDDTGVRLLLTEILTHHGYTVLEAVDGQDAIDIFMRHPDVDLMVLDSVMPRKNGRETYDAIRNMNMPVKVLFMSGYTKDIILDKGVEEGQVDFIAKPIVPDDLLAKLREVLDR